MECPLSKEELLELVEEEARLRVSAGFLQQVFAKLFSLGRFFLNFSFNRFFLIYFCLFQVELEEREGKTDGTVAIQRMQVELVRRHCLLRFCTIRETLTLSRWGGTATQWRWSRFWGPQGSGIQGSNNSGTFQFKWVKPSIFLHVIWCLTGEAQHIERRGFISRRQSSRPVSCLS